VTGFAPQWLALREAADRRSRSPAVLAATRLWADRRATRSGALRVVDLGAGTGSNLRCLVPHLPAPQMWTLVDHDPRLLALVRSARPRRGIAPMLGRGALRVRVIARDLAAPRPLDDILGGGHLITASALFDLVSEGWCRRLIREIARPGAALLAALTFDGRIAVDPADPFDSAMRALLNRHQRRDKGFGPALGPDATKTLARLTAAAGARLVVARSDWRLGRGETTLLQPLLSGWAAAAREAQPEQADAVDSWTSHRLAQSHAGLLAATVGHLDLLAVWRGTGSR
jgi:SAM-dependent methyltransferase